MFDVIGENIILQKYPCLPFIHFLSTSFFTWKEEGYLGVFNDWPYAM